MRAGAVDAVTFTSSSTVDNFCDLVGDVPDGGPEALALADLEERITTCRACPRLVTWREQVAAEMMFLPHPLRAAVGAARIHRAVAARGRIGDPATVVAAYRDRHTLGNVRLLRATRGDVDQESRPLQVRRPEPLDTDLLRPRVAASTHDVAPL